MSPLDTNPGTVKPRLPKAPSKQGSSERLPLSDYIRSHSRPHLSWASHSVIPQPPSFSFSPSGTPHTSKTEHRPLINFFRFFFRSSRRMHPPTTQSLHI